MFPPAPRAAGRVLALAATILLLVSLTAIAAPAGPTFKGDPQAISEVGAAYTKFGNAKSWRTRITAEGQVTTMELVLPDRFRLVITAGADRTEITNIGPDQWIKSGTTCRKSPVKAPVANPREYIEHSSDTTITVTKGGRETVEGTATQTYTLVVESRGTTTQQKFHVAVGTGYPRRIEMQTSRGPLTIDYFDFDAAIRIDPPC